MKTLWLPVWTLWQRELVRFYRQPSRIVGAIGSPLVFWLLIGTGLGNSFSHSGGGYLEYFFPGTLLLILLFTAIFSTITVIEDRREGFLQGVLVAPVPSFSIVLGKILGASTLALSQAALFLLIAIPLGVTVDPGRLPLVTGVLVINSFAMACLGFVIAWRMRSIQGFHAIMTTFLIPLWLLSGAAFPGNGSSVWLGRVVALNPLSYGLSALRQALDPAAASAGLPSMGLSIVVITVFSALLFLYASFLAAKRGVREVI